MNAKELIKSGKLSEARKVLIEEVKSIPSDMAKRTLLFQVQSLLGEWDKAEKNLDIIVSYDQKSETGVQVYKNLIQAERARADTLNLKARPSFLPKTPPYAELYFIACEKLAAKNTDEAVKLFEQIEEARPEISGVINGSNFTGFRDIDARLSFFLETFIHDKYVLIPIEELKEVVIKQPETLYDLLWTTAKIATWEGLSMQCYIPVLYADSCLHADDRVKLGRITEWESIAGPFVKGMGQRMFEAGKDDIPVLEIREINFTKTGDEGADEKTD